MPYKDKQQYIEYQRKYREKNKKQRKEYYQKNREEIKEYYQKNKEKVKEQKKEYYQKNKEKVKEKKKEYYQKNREEMKEKMEKYRQTPQGRKSYRIANWKHRGIIADDYDEWYEKYINCNECNFCHKEFTSTKNRHLDHHHGINDRENIRGILCRDCNFRDVFLDLLI